MFSYKYILNFIILIIIKTDLVHLKRLPTLVSSLELKSLSQTPSFINNYRILEAGIGEAAGKNYSEGHITDQAIYIDILKCTEPTELIPFNLPDMKCFQDYVSDLGLSNSHQLIIYDRSPFGFLTSSRMWWIFRLFCHEKISILNGGLNDWIKNGFELSTKTPNFEKEDFVIVKERKELKRNFEQIRKNIKSKKEQVVDVRQSADFEAGNIPYSQNLPYSNLFDPKTGLIKTKVELIKLFKGKPLITSCYSGISCTSLAVATYLIGLKDTSVYYGSWNEYSQRIKIY